MMPEMRNIKYMEMMMIVDGVGDVFEVDIPTATITRNILTIPSHGRFLIPGYDKQEGPGGGGGGRPAFSSDCFFDRRLHLHSSITLHLIARVQKTTPGMKKMITSILSVGAADMGLCRREH